MVRKHFLVLNLHLSALFLAALTMFYGLSTVGYAAQMSSQAVVLDVRVGVNASRTRVVLDLDRAVKFNVFTLPEPYRVVLNLPEVTWRVDPGALPESKGLLARMRYGLFAPGTSRMVLDMKGPVDVRKSFLLKSVDGKRWRLVLDMGPTTETEFLEALARKRKKDRKDLAALVARSTTKVPQTNAKPEGKTSSLKSKLYVQPKTRPAAQANASPVARSMTSKLPPRKPAVPGKHLIAIDPGHGGVDPGTIGIGKTYEKNVTLALAKDLKKQLESTGRYKVILTRSRDIFIRLRDRVSIARNAGAELFISIHADSVPNRKTRGLSIYTLSEKASDKEAAKLAAKENKSDLIAGIDLSAESMDVTNILLDLAQRETMNQSALFANKLVDELRRAVKLLPNTHRFAGFAVLKAPDMPSVLVESGFLSNRQDERNLLSRKYRRSLAHAIMGGVDQHFNGIEEASIR